MKRRLITLLLIGSLLPLFAACQQNQTGSPGEQQQPNGESAGEQQQQNEQSGENMEGEQQGEEE